MVSVPWVITTPSTSFWASSSFTLGQLQPHFIGHAFAGDLRNLLATYISHLGQLGYGGNHLVHAQLGSGVTNGGGAGGAGTGNGATGCQNHHVRLGRISRLGGLTTQCSHGAGQQHFEGFFMSLPL
jgi:hypothetical protein